jgi:3-dehydroquinate synthase
MARLMTEEKDLQREIKIRAANITYRVIIENDVLESIGKTMRLLFPSTKVMLVSDKNVFKIYGQRVVNSLTAANWQVHPVVLNPGEKTKNLNKASYLYDQALDAELDRNSPILAFGGGVIGDLAGFVASTYLRGVPLVMVPTSLLAQVDSSVGGKVAVNHPGGKNLIGSIYPPRLVLIDPQVLKTLPTRQLKAGLAEVIKYGIIADSAYFCWLEKNISRLMDRDLAALTNAITLAVMNKAKVVEADEYETDYRRVLNFGHTVGHALEAATGYRHYLHGEAVLAGMFAVTKMAGAMGILDSVDRERITNLLKRIHLKNAPPGLTAQAVIDKLRQDKKRRDGEIFFVLPRAVGAVTIMAVGDPAKILEAVKIVLRSDDRKV